MSTNRKVLMLPGDGIGPEVMHEVARMIEWMNNNRGAAFDIQEGLVGGSAYDAHGTSLTDETMADALAADAVLFGSVGGPKWDDVPREERPEAGLLRLRKEMDLFANLRPATVFDALADASTLKAEVVSGLDLMIVRRRGLFRHAARHRYAARRYPAWLRHRSLYRTGNSTRGACQL